MRNYRIEPIRDRRKRQLLHFMYCESKVKPNLNRRETNITLRSNNKVKFIEKLTRKTTIQNSPYYRGIQLWNKLPENIQKSGTTKVFKQKIKELKLTHVCMKGYYLTHIEPLKLRVMVQCQGYYLKHHPLLRFNWSKNMLSIWNLLIVI